MRRLCACALLAAAAAGAPPDLGTALAEAPWPKRARTNLSGAVSFEHAGARRLAVVADEGTRFAVVRETDLAVHVHDLYPALVAFDEKRFRVENPGDLEIDLEDVSFAEGRLYLAGSASWKRRKPNKRKPAKNRARLRTPVPASGEGRPHSNFVFRVRLGEAGIAVDAVYDVRRLLLGIEELRPFAGVPSKENGLEVEGLATKNGRHYLGLRGPVLRGHAVVVSTDLAFAHPRVHFLALGGGGVRALRETDEGFLLVSGPTMELPGVFALHAWTGDGDAFMGPGAHLSSLGPLTPPEGAKPEALFLWRGRMHLLHDGPDGGAPRPLR